MTSQLVDLDLVFRALSSNITPTGTTSHYGGPSPWGSTADRSSWERFAATTDHSRCPSIVRAWHDYHRSKGWAGLAYTSCVCPHGVRYEGRGPGKRTGANGTNDGNQRSYAVVYIAGDVDPLTDPAKVAFLDEGHRLGHPLRWDHSDWKATACAGDPIRAWEATGWAAPAAPPNPPTQEDEMVEITWYTDGTETAAYKVAGPVVDGRFWGHTGVHVQDMARLDHLRFLGHPEVKTGPGSMGEPLALADGWDAGMLFVNGPFANG